MSANGARILHPDDHYAYLEDEPPLSEEEVQNAALVWVDMAAVDETAPLQASVYTLPDGRGLFYRGKTHAVYGESGGGKSWVALAATAAELIAGERVAYLDFEADPIGIKLRLLSLGVPRDVLNTHLLYTQPQRPWTLLDPGFLHLTAVRPSLIVLDGMTTVLTMYGASSDSNDEVTLWMRATGEPLARQTGAAVVMIDHVVKANDSRGGFARGAGAKRDTITGAAFYAETKVRLGKGRRGEVKLRCTKDRHGAVDGLAGESVATSGSPIVAIACFEANDAGDVMRATLEGATTLSPGEMEDRGVARLLEEMAEGGKDHYSSNDLCNLLGGSRDVARRQVAEALARRVILQDGPKRQGHHTYRLAPGVELDGWAD